MGHLRTRVERQNQHPLINLRFDLVCTFCILRIDVCYVLLWLVSNYGVHHAQTCYELFKLVTQTFDNYSFFGCVNIS